MRDLPPKGTAGLARRSVSSNKRLPRPPANTYAMLSRASGPDLLVGSVIAVSPNPALFFIPPQKNRAWPVVAKLYGRWRVCRVTGHPKLLCAPYCLCLIPNIALRRC